MILLCTDGVKMLQRKKKADTWCRAESSSQSSKPVVGALGRAKNIQNQRAKLHRGCQDLFHIRPCETFITSACCSS